MAKAPKRRTVRIRGKDAVALIKARDATDAAAKALGLIRHEALVREQIAVQAYRDASQKFEAHVREIAAARNVNLVKERWAFDVDRLEFRPD